MNIVQVNIKQQTDRGERVLTERFITALNTKEEVEAEIQLHFGLVSLDDIDKFGRQVTGVEIHGHKEKLFPIGG